MAVSTPTPRLPQEVRFSRPAQRLQETTSPSRETLALALFSRLFRGRCVCCELQLRRRLLRTQSERFSMRWEGVLGLTQHLLYLQISIVDPQTAARRLEAPRKAAGAFCLVLARGLSFLWIHHLFLPLLLCHLGFLLLLLLLLLYQERLRQVQYRPYHLLPMLPQLLINSRDHHRLTTR